LTRAVSQAPVGLFDGKSMMINAHAFDVILVARSEAYARVQVCPRRAHAVRADWALEFSSKTRTSAAKAEVDWIKKMGKMKNKNSIGLTLLGLNLTGFI
jgi:hypothetical protein